MNVREAYTNCMTSSTDATLFNVLFVLAASAQIHVEASNKYDTPLTFSHFSDLY